MGRSSRQGFPERYGWDDIVRTYSSASSSGDRYVYFGFLEAAFDERDTPTSDHAHSKRSAPIQQRPQHGRDGQ